MAAFRASLLLFFVAWAQIAASVEPRVGDRFSATDSLNCATDANEDASRCLADLSWTPTAFEVHLEAAEPGCGDWLVRFPSARPQGDAVIDLASMEWFAARDRQGTLVRAPAIVVVHESGRAMTVGRIMARGLSSQGVHALMLHLPGYGARRNDEAAGAKRGLPSLQQAIADARRARDAVAALPVVDPTVIGLQGTSLGGFVTATTAGLDHGYNRVFILLAGGNLHDVVLHGAKDAAKTREKLAAAGVSVDQIIELARQVEPLRLAHRLRPAETWLYSGKRDDVVPPACSTALAQAAKLPADHHIELDADHYSGIIYLPQIVQAIAGRMKPAADAAAAP